MCVCVCVCVCVCGGGNIRQSQDQKFGDTRKSNVELNVDCLARH